jgi:decaprenylphospho-beta-D-erythro-pentofuranosid-2-ulose 2-reductase
MKKCILIYGGTSQISHHIIFNFYKNNFNFIVFSTNNKKVQNFINKNNLTKKRFIFYQANLNSLKKNILFINKIKFKLYGAIWVAGMNGDSRLEMNKESLALKNLNVNLVYPLLLMNIISKKIKNGGFISMISSVAGLRGRSKRLIYCVSKSGLITYLSGLRQLLFKRNILVNTVIPGYISTQNFFKEVDSAPSFLVNSPSDLASKIYKSIICRNEITYSNNIWRFIFIIIRLIPENIFKRFKF